MKARYIAFLLLTTMQAFWLSIVQAAPQPIDISINFSNGTAVQQNIVSEAASEWESLLLQPVGRDASFTLHVSFADLGPIDLAIVDPLLTSVDADDIPLSAHLVMSTNAAVYYDPDTQTANDIPPGSYDALTIARRELAHALGFLRTYAKFSDCIDGANQFECRGITANLTPVTTHLDSAQHPGDLMNPTLDPGVRIAPSTLDQNLLKVAFGYSPGAHFIYVLDRSSSMENARATGNSRCEDAILAAIGDINEIFRQYPPATNSAMEIWTLSNNTIFQLTDGFVDQQTAISAINSLDLSTCGGEASLADAICDATDVLGDEIAPYVASQNTQIVLSSDGNESTSSDICAGGDSAIATPPYSMGSWQNLVRTHLQSQGGQLSTRLWSDDTQAIDSGDGSQIPTGGGPSSAFYFHELATLTGGQFSIASDASKLVPTNVFVLFGSNFELPNVDINSDPVITINGLINPSVAVPAAPILEGAGFEQLTALTISATDPDGNMSSVTGSPSSATPSILSSVAVDDSNMNNITMSVQLSDDDVNGTALIDLLATDTDGEQTTAQVELEVVPVNDRPSFTAGANQVVTANAGAQSINAWATNISAGPSNEAHQQLTFQVINNTNASLFSVQPAVTPNGRLTFTPALGHLGTATVTIVLSDDGGTANGGLDTSAAASFQISVIENNPVYPGNRTYPPGCDNNPVPGTAWQTIYYKYEKTYGTWPGIGVSETINIFTNQWVAMWFPTEDEAYSSGALRTNEAPWQGAEGTRVKMMKISECPGDFTDDVPGQTCRFDSPVNNGELRWESGDIAGTGSVNRCTLQRNKGYYLNIIFGEQDDPSDTTCKSNDGSTIFPQCGFFMIPDPD